MRTTTQDTVRHRFFAPVELALASAGSKRKCREFPDEEYLESGISRVLSQAQSGRDWVQRLRMWMDSGLTVGNFFDTLRSSRRLALVEEVTDRVCHQLDATAKSGHDTLAEHPELHGFAVYASDGHYESPSCHAKQIDGKAQPAGSFFSMNLRSQGLRLLDVARPKKQREHDMSVLKRLGSTQLRMGEPTGTRVIHAYDPAGIDYKEWFRWKCKGVYIISREKDNSKAEVVGLNTWDEQDPRNTGILADELIGVFCGVMLRRVRYRDPATGKEFSFITSEMTLPPGLIAFIYLLRWDIEKVFDEKKNKLQEKKAWATSLTARCQQAHFVCLAHNLMVLFEIALEENEGIRDEKVDKKRERRNQIAQALAKERGDTLNPLVVECVRRTQRSLQFIRWLRHCLFRETSWCEGMRVLRPLMVEYLV